LTHRIRSKAFACLLRQEVAYFDQSENSSGAICVRLSSDAAAIQAMTGTRLGVICEAFALSCFGLIFGIFISWQLTIITFVALLIIGIVVYLDMRLILYQSQKSDVILGHASSVRLDFYS
jgi:ATP-binding cassette subfamily B (MDR/TAP) protein 1